MVAGGVGGVGGGCRESECHREFRSLSRIIREPEGALTPGRPRTGPKQGKKARKLPIYNRYFRSAWKSL